MKEVTLEPNWPNMARWYGEMLAQQGFVPGAYEMVAAYATIIAKLAIENPGDLVKVIEGLNSMPQPTNYAAVMSYEGEEDGDTSSYN